MNNKNISLWSGLVVLSILSVVLFITSISFWQENVSLRQELQKLTESPADNSTFVRSVTKILQAEDRLFELTNNKPTMLELLVSEETHGVVVTIPMKISSPSHEFESFTVWTTWIKENENWHLIRTQYSK